MTPCETYDIAIIGAGAGGLSVAAVSAQLNLKVVIIEQHKMGSDCLNYGCVPSKAFLAAANAAQAHIKSSSLGITYEPPTISFKAVMQHVSNVIKSIEPHDSAERFTSLGATVYHEHASFIDKHTIKAGNRIIKANRIIIATGSRPFIPPINGLDACTYYTNETIFTLTEKPKQLIVIGGGPIGCELAQGFAHLGTDVTLLEAFTIMPKDDAELVSSLREHLIESGIHIYEHCKVLNVTQSDGSITVRVEEENGTTRCIEGTHLLVATGRQANIDTLALEKAGINHTPKGIVVNRHLQTSNKRIYAIGDAAGPFQFTHMANYQAGIVIQNVIFKLPSKASYHAVPWVTYTSPPLAHIGLIHQDAIKQYPNAKCITLDFSQNDRAQTEGNTIGKIKVTVLPNGNVLGATILAPHADELILPWIILITNKKSLRDLTKITIPYPTLNEISKRVASEFYSKKLYSTWVKRIVNVFKYF